MHDFVDGHGDGPVPELNDQNGGAGARSFKGKGESHSKSDELVPDGPNKQSSGKLRRILNEIDISEQITIAKTKRGKQSVELIVAGLIVVNTLLMGVEADYPEFLTLWFVIENVFTAAFFAEMVMKICMWGRVYFHRKGNLLDVSIVFIAIVDNWVLPFMNLDVDGRAFMLMRTLRLFRLVRVVRLIKGCRKLFLVVAGMIDAMEATLWVSGVLLITIYVSAIFCVDFLGKNKSATEYPGYTTIQEEIDDTEVMQGYNPYTRFGSMGRAMITLFNMVLLAEWAEIITPIMEKQPVFLIFFICFVLTTTLCTMNVIIGMICDSVMQHHQQIREAEEALECSKRLNVLESIQQIVQAMATHDEKITWEKLQEGFEGQDSQLSALFWHSELRLPSGFSASELLCMLDHNCEGALGHEEFVQSLYRLMDSDPFQHRCIIQTSLNSLRWLVIDSHQKTRQMIKENQKVTHAMLQSLRASLQSHYQGKGFPDGSVLRQGSTASTQGEAWLLKTAPTNSVQSESWLPRRSSGRGESSVQVPGMFQAPSLFTAEAPAEVPGNERVTRQAEAPMRSPIRLPWVLKPEKSCGPSWSGLSDAAGDERKEQLARLAGVADAADAKLLELRELLEVTRRTAWSEEPRGEQASNEVLRVLEAVALAVDAADAKLERDLGYPASSVLDLPQVRAFSAAHPPESTAAEEKTWRSM